jgi:hypothetical protein
MPRTPTGRPPGRPKSSTGYTTLMCRLPTDKAKRIIETARQREITVSALLREALDAWLQTHLPQTRLLTSPPPRPSLTELQTLSARPEPVTIREGGSVLTQITTHRRGLRHPTLPSATDICQTETIPSAGLCQTETVPWEDKCQTTNDADNRLTESSPQTDTCQTETSSDPQGIPPEACPAFDAGKFVLGNLCPERHEWGTTRRSLLRLPSRNCPQCVNAHKRRKRAAQRQAAQP